MKRSRLGGIGEAFSDRNFRIYTVGSLLSWLSFFIQAVAMAWTTWELTHSPLWLAIIGLLDMVPNVILLPFGGALADRYDRFRIVVIAYAAALLQALVLAVLAYSGALTLGLLGSLALVHGVIHSFSVPGAYGMLPRFVARKRLSSAIAVNAAYTQFAIFAGPALGGWIILHYGVAAAFAVNAAGYGVFLAMALFLKTPTDYVPPPLSGRSIVSDIRAGVSYIASHAGMRSLLLLMLLGDAMSSGIYQMMPAIAADLTGTAGEGAGVAGMSSLLSAAGLGATATALWLAHGGAGAATVSRVLWAFLAFGLNVAILGFVQGLVAAISVMVVLGIANELRRTATVSILQSSVKEEMRGRVMSTQFLFQRAAGGLGTILIGTIAAHIGLRVPLVTLALVSIVVATTTLLRRQRIISAFDK